MRRITKIAAASALAVTAIVGCSTAANAATVTPGGTGFVGKGEVQSAFNLSNGKIQPIIDNDLNAFAFRAVQPTVQLLSQDVSQAGTQAGSQVGTEYATQTATQYATMSVSQDLTCTYTNGNGTKTFHRDGVREGDREGDRTGSREGDRTGIRTGDRDGVRAGSQSGAQSGSLAAGIDAKARKTGQWTGWNIMGWKTTPAYSTTGVPVWQEPSYGENAWVFDTDYAFGDYAFDANYVFDPEYTYDAWTAGDFESIADVAWGDWDALPGENPDDCLRSVNADKITQISNVIDAGDLATVSIVRTVENDVLTNVHVVDGIVEDGLITPGAVTPIDPVRAAGPVTANGAAKVFVTYNGVEKAL
jgi:hypothetical protein